MKRTQATGSHRRYRAKGCALQAARKRQEWTQEQVVGKLSRLNVVIDTRTYRRWEQGRSSMLGEQAQTLCTIFQQPAQELGLWKEHAEDASHEHSFSLEIEKQASLERADALHAPGQNGDEMVTFAQLLLPSSSVVRIAVLHISREDLLDVLRQRCDEQPSSLPSIAFPNGGSMYQDLILSILWPVDQNTST